MGDTHVVLPGSQRPAKGDAVRVGDVDPTAPLTVTVTVRGPELPDPAEPMAREELEHRYGARKEDMAKVAATLEQYGLKVEDSSPLSRSLRVSGTARQMEDAFHPGLGIYRSDEQGDFRGRQGKLQIPSELDGLVTGVFGLDQRRVAHRKAGAVAAATEQAAVVGHGSKGSLTPSDLEAHYAFPAGRAAGQTIAIAEFGGAYFPDDLAAFCTQNGRSTPDVQQVGVGVPVLTLDDIRQLPKTQRIQVLNESVEVNMDVQIVAGLCPEAEIVVYFAQFDQKGWVDLLNEVIANKPAAPVTLSVSWGLAEDVPDWSHAALQAINERLHAASVLGITVCVAAGDDGSGDQVRDGRAHVDFPASSPFVLAVGGTKLTVDEEVVWWDAPGERTPHGGGATGGGVSVEFGRPAWQQNVNVGSINPGSFDGRVIPDVSALAGAPLYDLLFLGQPLPNGGTSASAPLWASLIARIAASRDPATPLAFLPPLLYETQPNGRPLGQSALVDITRGNNTSPQPGRGYNANTGYDPASGWGVPNGQALAGAL